MTYFIEKCPTCFTIQGSWWEIRKQIKKHRKVGHLLFEKKKIKRGIYQAIMSTIKRPGVR